MVDGRADNVVATADGKGLDATCKPPFDSEVDGRGHGYHAVSAEDRVGLQDAVGSRVITSGVHGIRARFVQRGWEPHIAGSPTRDGDVGYSHGDVVFSLQAPGVRVEKD